MKRFLYGVISGLLLTAAMDAALAADARPLPTFNQSPLIQIYGLPALGPATTLSAGANELQLDAALANNFTGEARANELVVLDGETHRFTLAWRRGLSDGDEVGIELPYVFQTGGFLDHTIDTWHDTFNLADGGRGAVPRDRLLYQYINNGHPRVDVHNASDGIGDIRLTAARSAGADAALRASLKLPTGASDDLHGSGGTDLAVWLSHACANCAQVGWYGGGGVLWLSAGDVLPEQQRHWVGFGTVGASWQAWPAIALKVQIDAHTPFYHSALTPLSSATAQLLLGGTWSLTRDNAIDLAVSEDVVVNTSPDVVFNLAWRTLF